MCNVSRSIPYVYMQCSNVKHTCIHCTCIFCTHRAMCEMRTCPRFDTDPDRQSDRNCTSPADRRCIETSDVDRRTSKVHEHSYDKLSNWLKIHSQSRTRSNRRDRIATGRVQEFQSIVNKATDKLDMNDTQYTYEYKRPIFRIFLLNLIFGYVKGICGKCRRTWRAPRLFWNVRDEQAALNSRGRGFRWEAVTIKTSPWIVASAVLKPTMNFDDITLRMRLMYVYRHLCLLAHPLIHILHVCAIFKYMTCTCTLHACIQCTLIRVTPAETWSNKSERARTGVSQNPDRLAIASLSQLHLDPRKHGVSRAACVQVRAINSERRCGRISR